MPIKFEGAVDLVSGNIEISIKFPDENKAEGLLKKDNPNACIEQKLFRYKQSYTEQVEDTSEIKSTYDDTNKIRKWALTIPAADFATKLIVDE